MMLRQPDWGRVLIAVLGMAVMAFGALSVLSSGYSGGEYVPSHADAFYHARRILDAVMTGQPVIQFDDHIHVPEGSWLTWPWGFDQVMAWIVSAFGPFRDEQSAARILMLVPLVCVSATIVLMVWLTSQLRMTPGMAALAVLTFAAVPMNFMRYSIGNIDHHFAEQIWTLASLCCVVWLLRQPGRWLPPVVLGGVLGTGVAIHNGLFLLPVLVVVSLGVVWLRGLPLPSRSRLDALAVSLLLATLLVCIPSRAWRDGAFQYQLLSWFHVYVALCGAVFIAWMGRVRPSPRVLLGMAGMAVVLALAAWRPIASGAEFVSGNLAPLDDVVEAQSPYAMIAQYGPERSTRLFTWLIWLAFPATLINLWWAWKSRSAPLVAFAVASPVLLLLLQSQMRLGVFGAMSLAITPALAMDQLAPKLRDKVRAARMMLVLLTLVCFLPTKGFFGVSWIKGGDPSYAVLGGALKTLGEACRARPGIVLAPVNAGHWVRFHTACPVIGNVFLLTDQHFRKVQETNALLVLSPQQLQEERPDIRYVMAYIDVEAAAQRGMGEPTPADVETQRQHEPLLMRELLRDAPPPPGYRQIAEGRSRKGGVHARIFEVGPLAGAAP